MKEVVLTSKDISCQRGRCPVRKKFILGDFVYVHGRDFDCGWCFGALPFEMRASRPHLLPFPALDFPHLYPYSCAFCPQPVSANG